MFTRFKLMIERENKKLGDLLDYKTVMDIESDFARSIRVGEITHQVDFIYRNGKLIPAWDSDFPVDLDAERERQYMEDYERHFEDRPEVLEAIKYIESARPTK